MPKAEYYYRISESLADHNRFHRSQHTICNQTWNVLLATLATSRRPLAELGELQCLKYPDDHVEQGGQLLGWRLPLILGQVEKYKCDRLRVIQPQLCMWGLHGSEPRQLGLILREGAKTFAWSTGIGSGVGFWSIGQQLNLAPEDLSEEMLQWVEKAFKGPENVCNIFVEIAYVGHQTTTKHAFEENQVRPGQCVCTRGEIPRATTSALTAKMLSSPACGSTQMPPASLGCRTCSILMMTTATTNGSLPIMPKQA